MSNPEDEETIYADDEQLSIADSPTAPFTHLLTGLNDEQRAAVTTTHGPVLILAGPGSGKTRVITHRIAYLIEAEHIAPWNILAVTFTNKAAKEMKERLEKLIGPRAKHLNVGTFHSICARILRSEIETMDFGRDSHFTILDDDEQSAIVREAMKALDLNEKQYKANVIRSIISKAKNDLMTPRMFAEHANKYIDEIAARVYTRYDTQMRAQNAVDFDDLILLTHQLWSRNPEALARSQERYHFIHVDEFQDCNHAQYELMRLLAVGWSDNGTPSDQRPVGRRNICVVGDEDQCLIAGTQITMADGSQRPIESVREGDMVCSAYGSGDFRPARVLAATQREPSGVGVCITLRSGRTLVSTLEHTHFAGYRLGITPQTFLNNKRVIITLCGDRRGATPMHRISIVGNDPQARSQLEALGYSVRAAKAEGASESWRYETINTNMALLLEKAEQIKQAIDGEIIFNARLGGNTGEIIESNSLPFIHAASVQPGMVMFDANGGYDIVERVGPSTLDAPLYDFDIAGTHNFIANGIVTHNSIYSWRGASAKNIIEFEHEFPQRALIILARNYRSTETILEAAMQVVRRNASHIEKHLTTINGKGDQIEVREVYNEEEEGKFVADTVRLLQSRNVAKLSECAVLYRTNAQSRAIEEQFLRAGVPYVVIGSRKFYERKEIRDVIAYLRLISNPGDVTSMKRIINVPTRKIGDTTMNHLLAFAAQRGVAPLDAIAAIDEHPTLATFSKEALKRFGSVMSDLRISAAAIPLDQLIDRILERTGYAGELRDGSEEGEERWRNVLELRRVAEDYAEVEPDASLPLFLENVALIGGADTTQTSAENPELVNEPRDAVTLITLHAAKGLEFPVVFLVGMEEGVLPHSRSFESQEQLEEERRLAYVGITRAMKKLYLVRAFRRSFFGGNSVLQEPSRFIDDISRSLRDDSSSTREGARSGGAGGTTETKRPSAGGSYSGNRTPAPFVSREQRGVPNGAPPPPAAPRPGTPRPDFSTPEVTEPEPATPAREPQMGDKVRHRLFGPGLVVKVSKEHDSTTVDVLFERTNVGRRTLDLAFAKLEVVS